MHTLFNGTVNAQQLLTLYRVGARSQADIVKERLKQILHDCGILGLHLNLNSWGLARECYVSISLSASVILFAGSFATPRDPTHASRGHGQTMMVNKEDVKLSALQVGLEAFDEDESQDLSTRKRAKAKARRLDRKRNARCRGIGMCS